SLRRLCCPVLVSLLVVATAKAQAPRFRLGPCGDIQEQGKKRVSEGAQQAGEEAMTAPEKGRSADARRLFRTALTLAPGNAPILINLALIEYREKRYADAETLARSAAKSAPESGLPWLVLGVLQYEQNKLDAALASLAMSVYLEPKDARTHH